MRLNDPADLILIGIFVLPILALVWGKMKDHTTPQQTIMPEYRNTPTLSRYDPNRKGYRFGVGDFVIATDEYGRDLPGIVVEYDRSSNMYRVDGWSPAFGHWAAWYSPIYIAHDLETV